MDERKPQDQQQEAPVHRVTVTIFAGGAKLHSIQRNMTDQEIETLRTNVSQSMITTLPFQMFDEYGGLVMLSAGALASSAFVIKKGK